MFEGGKMKILNTGSSRVMLLAIAAGAVAFWHLYVQQSQMLTDPAHIYDSKYGAAIEALGLIGLIAIVISNCLKTIEKRLDTLERGRYETNREP
jgi:hypothetical protein